MDNKFRSRKFMLAATAMITGIAGLFGGQLSGGEFIALVATVLALYGGANVMESRGQG